ncbi:hypothetical protein YC2023_057617 [Brassica napus]
MSELFDSLPTWDLHDLGSLFNQNFNLGIWPRNVLVDACYNIDESPGHILRSPEVDIIGDVSTGYLEDALIKFSVKSKRRRLSFNAEDKPNNHFDNDQNDWRISENYSCTSSQFADESPNSSINIFSESSNQPKHSFEPSSSTSEKHYCDNKKRVVYPFGLVKPGGREEDVTLNDINKKILMPSARPVRHPVGAFACRPCLSAHGPGLSGKVVVAFTKIQTSGRGLSSILLGRISPSPSCLLNRIVFLSASQISNCFLLRFSSTSRRFSRQRSSLTAEVRSLSSLSTSHLGF